MMPASSAAEREAAEQAEVGAVHRQRRLVHGEPHRVGTEREERGLAEAHDADLAPEQGERQRQHAEQHVLRQDVDRIAGDHGGQRRRAREDDDAPSALAVEEPAADAAAPEMGERAGRSPASELHRSPKKPCGRNRRTAIASANTTVCANAWLEASAMMVSDPPMKKLPTSVPPSSCAEAADGDHEERAHQVDVADIGIDAQHRADQRAGEPGDERAAREHELVGAADVKAEQARHLAVLDQGPDADAERGPEEHEGGAAQQQQREAGDRRAVGRHRDWPRLKASGKGLVTFRKSVPNTILINSVAIRKKPQVRSSVSNGRS